MTFFKGHHAQRKTSDRKRVTSLDTIVQHLKSESSSSRSASLPSITDNEESIDLEVEHLFRRATGGVSSSSKVPAAADHRQSGQYTPKTESSLFLRFMKRREHPSGLPSGLKKSRDYQEPLTKRTVPRGSGDDDRVQSSTPDFTSETGYDSDARFISSPRFSEQSWDSLRASSTSHMKMTTTSIPMNLELHDKKKSQKIPSTDSDIFVLPSTEHRQSYVLSIPKRRGQQLDDKNHRSHSLQAADIILNNNDCQTVGNDPVAIVDLRKRSRFTEMFNHLGLTSESAPQQPRKVSIGWMSEGKRCGYGYSFVDSNESTHKSSDPDLLGDDFPDSKAKIPDKDIIAADDDNFDPNKLKMVKHGEQHQDEEDKRSNFKTETANIPNSRTYWTAFPSQTKAERNQPVSIDDGIIIRDFCTKASPERPQHEDSVDEKKRHLISNAVRQGFHDTFLWMIGLGKREIARYHAGLDVHVARSHDYVDPTFEMTVPYWDHVPKEELGDYHIEAWKRASSRRKSRQQQHRRHHSHHHHHRFENLKIAASRLSLSGSKTNAHSTTTTPDTTKDVQGEFSSNSNGDNGRRHARRRHSSSF